MYRDAFNKKNPVHLQYYMDYYSYGWSLRSFKRKPATTLTTKALLASCVPERSFTRRSMDKVFERAKYFHVDKAIEVGNDFQRCVLRGYLNLGRLDWKCSRLGLQMGQSRKRFYVREMWHFGSYGMKMEVW